MYKPNLSDYAYGWTITKTSFGAGVENAPIITHTGGINGFNTVIARFPVQKHLVVLLDNTSQGGALNGIQREIVNILYGQPHELPRLPVADVLIKTITEKGIEAGLAQYRDLKTREAKVYDFREPELNRLGYQLMQQKKLKEAIEIFKLNVAEYPRGFNTYDSLAEAYMNNGDTELATLNYKKSLELNPQNTSATEALKRLENKPAEVAAVKTSYDDYVGEYEVTPTFKAAVYKEGEKLMAQATDQPAIELYPETADKFILKVIDAKVTFTRDDKGQVTGLVIHQGGQNIPGKKTK